MRYARIRKMMPDDYELSGDPDSNEEAVFKLRNNRIYGHVTAEAKYYPDIYWSPCPYNVYNVYAESFDPRCGVHPGILWTPPFDITI